MRSFKRFLALLATIPDPRRGQGQMYKLPYLLLFSILAVVAGANSYRGICTFIQVHRGKLNRAFALGWRRAPAYTSIRYILQGLKAEDVEKVFRAHAALLDDGGRRRRCLALDGKALRGSFDAFNDQRGKQVLSVFATAPALVLAQVEIDEKSNEIPTVQKLLETLDVAGQIVTLDAMHCQKKPLPLRPKRKRISSSN
jgi:hypothetical protein